MQVLRVLLRIGVTVACSLTLVGFGFGATELRSQRELSDVAGVFSPSRYLTYEGSDAHHHHFRERGKFGWLGPSGRFRIARDLIAFEPLAAGSLLTYEQNSGTFVLQDQNTGRRVRFKADFQETHTVEEERYLKAIERLSRSETVRDRDGHRRAMVEVMFAAYGAGHRDDALRHADEVIGLQDPDSAHSAHVVAGSIALARGDREQARIRLLASANVSPSPAMKSFGPNMSLAKALLDAGETPTVLEYLEACKAFWKVDVLQAWQTQIRKGTTPGFGANLYYGLR